MFRSECAAQRGMFQPPPVNRTTLSSSFLLLHFLHSFLLCPPVLPPSYLSGSFSPCSLVCQVLGNSGMPVVECRKQSGCSLATVCSLWLHCCFVLWQKLYQRDESSEAAQVTSGQPGACRPVSCILKFGQHPATPYLLIVCSFMMIPRSRPKPFCVLPGRQWVIWLHNDLAIVK